MKNFTKQIKTLEQIILVFLFSIFFNLNLQSQTSGPTAPDFKGFTPINNNNLVNEFDGSFNYSIPVLSLPSGTKEVFNMALTYRSGMSPNEDASWVGFGWNLNPGIIQRQLKGFPDDFKNADVIFINATMPSITAFKTSSANIEILSRDKKPKDPSKNLVQIKEVVNEKKTNEISFLIKQSFNNRTGSYINYNASASVPSIATTGNLGGDSRGNMNFGLNFDLLNGCTFLGEEIKQAMFDLNNSESFFSKLVVGTAFEYKNDFGSGLNGGRSSFYTGNNWGKGQYPLNINEYDYSHYEIAAKFQLRYAWIGSEIGFKELSFGNEVLDFNNFQQKKVSGYLHLKESFTNKDVLLDYYNENENGVSPRNRYLPIPFQNSDNFIVSGQGISGSFRFDLNQNQMFRTTENRRSDNSYVGSITAGYDFTATSWLFGADLNYTNKSMYVDEWYKFQDYYLYNILIKNKYYKFIDYENINKVYYDDYIARFSGDLTSSISNYKLESAQYRNMFSPISASLNSTDDFSIPNLSGFTEEVNEMKTIGRSSYIRTKFEGEKIIGFEVVKNDGTIYIYDLPIENKEEGNIQYFMNNIYNNNLENTNYIFSKDGKILYLKGELEKTLPKVLNKVNDENQVGTYKRDGINTNYNPYDQEGNKYVSGRFTDKEYNSAFLLTKILNSNYIDILNNGPTIDDIGDYVVFNYRAAYSGENKLEWREPYMGLTYNKGQLSSAIDEVGSMMFGKKDVYYLESIESKTHIAVFVTNLSKFNESVNSYNKNYIIRDKENNYNLGGSQISDKEKLYFSEIKNKLNGTGNKRKDCVPAITNEEKALQGNLTSREVNYEESKIQYLEKVLLFTKDISPRNNNESNTVYIDNLVSTVNLVYDLDYPIWTGLPNSSEAKGKLTLKAVYTENELVSENKSNPYIFNYSIENTDLSILNLSDDLIEKKLNFKSTNLQEPTFNYWNIDKWNNYNDINNDITNTNINIREDFLLNNNNSILKHNQNFDPSAWNLKKITNPSQSDLLVFYEENDYSFVQDRSASLLVSGFIKDPNNENKIIFSKNTLKAKLNLPNENLSTAFWDNLIIFWKSKFTKKDIYYKFYFQMLDVVNDAPCDMSLGNDYISGFNEIKNITIDPNNSDNIIFEFNKMLPYQKCDNFVRNVDGLLYEKNNNLLTSKLEYGINGYILDTKKSVEREIPSLFEGALKDDYNCRDFCPEYSYLRLPIPEYLSKKGGGVRVKCLLTIDKFESENEKIVDGSTTVVDAKPQVSGTEYIYKNSLIEYEGKFVYSSGVATNEPDAGNEENSLYDKLVNLDEESSFNLSGDFGSLLGLNANQKAQEFNDDFGLIGQSILPSPSISYSKIYTKPLILDIANEGQFKSKSITVSEFFTVKDYPYDGKIYLLNEKEGYDDSVNCVTFTNIDKEDNIDWYYNLINMLPAPIKITNDNYAFSQGYQFILHNMHGKPKHKSTFAFTDLTIEKEWDLGTQTKYEYFEVGEAVPIINKKEDLLSISINSYDYDWLGMKMTLSNENRSLTNVNVSGSLGFDLGIFIGSAIPTSYSIAPSLNVKKDKYNYITSNKIIEFYPQVKKITNIVDDIVTEVENVAFDSKSGIPVLQKTNSSYTGVAINNNSDNEYFSYSVLGDQEYENLSSISDNEGICLLENKFPGESLSPLFDFTILEEGIGPNFTYRVKLDAKRLQKTPPSDNYQEVFEFLNLCEIKKLINNGDIVEIITNKNKENERKCNFIVDNIDCMNLHITPYTGDLFNNFTNSTLGTNPLTPAVDLMFVDNTKEIPNLEIRLVRSSNQNKLGNKISTTTFVNPNKVVDTELPSGLFQIEEINNSNYYLSQNEWESRYDFVNFLNDNIQNIVTTSLAGDPNLITLPPFAELYNINEVGASGTPIFTNYTLNPTIDLSLNFNLNDLNIQYNLASNVNLDYIFLNIPLVASTLFTNDPTPLVTTPNDIDVYTLTNTNGYYKNPNNNKIYKPFVFYFNLRLNGVKDMSTSSNYNQRFASIIYSCIESTTLQDQFLVPKFEVTQNGDIRLKPIEINSNNYIYNVNYTVDLQSYLNTNYTYNELNSSLLSGDNVLLVNYTNELLDLLNNYHNQRIEVFNGIRDKQLSYNIEALDFKKNFQPNLISVNSNKFINSQAVYLEKYLNSDFNITDSYSNLFNLTLPNPITTDLNFIKAIDEVKNENLLLKHKLDNNNFVKSNYSFYKSKFNNYLSSPNYNNNNGINGLNNNNLTHTINNNYINLGTVSDTFKLFNWRDINQNTYYINQIENLNFNQNLDVTTVKNQLGNYSGIGYDDFYNLFPEFSIENINPEIAFYQNFEDYKTIFKNYYNTTNLNNITNLSEDAFTGNFSFKLKLRKTSNITPLSDYYHYLPNLVSVNEINKYRINSITSMTADTFLVEAWVKYDIINRNRDDYDVIINKLKNKNIRFNIHNADILNLNYARNNLNMLSGGINPPSFVQIELVPQQVVGEWILVRGEVKDLIKNMDINDNNKLIFSISTNDISQTVDILSIESATETTIEPFILVDDLKFYPIEANTSCYVIDYENNYRIAAMFDNNHIPIKYVYNQKGEMNKTKIVTIEGEKTIKESHLNLRNINKTDIPSLQTNNENSSSSIKMNNNTNINSQNSVTPEFSKKLNLNNELIDSLKSNENSVNSSTEQSSNKINEFKKANIDKLNSKLNRKNIYNNNYLQEVYGQTPQETKQGKKFEYNYKNSIIKSDSLNQVDSLNINKLKK